MKITTVMVDEEYHVFGVVVHGSLVPDRSWHINLLGKTLRAS